MRRLADRFAARYGYQRLKPGATERQITALDQRYGAVAGGREIVFVGTLDRPSFVQTFKLSPTFYLPLFCETAAASGIKVRLGPDPRELPGLLRRLAKPLFVLVYNEVLSDKEQIRDVAFLVERCFPGAPIANRPEPCLALGDKREIHALYSGHGIAMPRRIEAEQSGEVVFSNEARSSGAKTSVRGVGERLNVERYNTAFVDTVRRIDGADYHITIRALAVGRACVGLYAGARPTHQGNASVHLLDTPRDRALLERLHSELIAARRTELEALCRQIGAVLGLGFFAHDILPCADTGRLLVCESGIKFNNREPLKVFAGIGEDLPMYADMFSGEECRRSAQALIGQAEQASWLP
jgi:hypothetical protein